jgi:uncharacterized protein YrzB (UPF0473 family)
MNRDSKDHCQQQKHEFNNEITSYFDEVGKEVHVRHLKEFISYRGNSFQQEQLLLAVLLDGYY